LAGQKLPLVPEYNKKQNQIYNYEEQRENPKNTPVLGWNLKGKSQI
jgi:hypothetical protein